MKVVMTGAAGGVGTMIRPHLRRHFDRLVLSDRVEISDLEGSESFVRADLTDLAAMERLLEGADGLIHLGGHSVEGPWQAILDANIIGLYNAYEAARRQGCQRIVFATTNHVVGFYRRQRTIDHTVMPRPDFALRRQQGVRRGARPHVRRQARHARAQHPDRQCRPQAGRPAPPVDLDQPARSRPAHADRPRAPGHPFRGRLRRLATTPAPGTTTATPIASATGPTTSRRTTPRRRPRPTPRSPPIWSPSSSRAGRSAASSSPATSSASMRRAVSWSSSRSTRATTRPLRWARATRNGRAPTTPSSRTRWTCGCSPA